MSSGVVSQSLSDQLVDTCTRLDRQAFSVVGPMTWNLLPNSVTRPNEECCMDSVDGTEDLPFRSAAGHVERVMCCSNTVRWITSLRLVIAAAAGCIILMTSHNRSTRHTTSFGNVCACLCASRQFILEQQARYIDSSLAIAVQLDYRYVRCQLAYRDAMRPRYGLHQIL